MSSRHASQSDPAASVDAAAVEQPGGQAPQWRSALYIAGKSPTSMSELRNVQRLRDELFAGNYEIELVDLMVRPELAQLDQVFAVPTLIRRLPHPIKRIVGDLPD